MRQVPSAATLDYVGLKARHAYGIVGISRFMSSCTQSCIFMIYIHLESGARFDDNVFNAELEYMPEQAQRQKMQSIS